MSSDNPYHGPKAEHASSSPSRRVGRLALALFLLTVFAIGSLLTLTAARQTPPSVTAPAR